MEHVKKTGDKATMSAYMKARYNELKADGCCTACGVKLKAGHKGLKCAGCQEKQREQNRKHSCKVQLKMLQEAKQCRN